MRAAKFGTRRARLLAVALLSLAVVLVAAWLPPLSQPVHYHDFADQRSMFGVPHALNVVSSLGFVIVGGFGLRGLRRADSDFADARERWPYALFFLAIVAVGLGSATYHLAPGHESLFWDRLPMSVAFMSLFSSVLVERLGPRIGLCLFPWLALAGPLSVIWWLLSERADAGDLRAYALVQFYPMLLMPLLMALFAPRYTRGGDVLLVLALYLGALAADRMDREIFAAVGWISGHTLKHLLAALAVAWLWRMLNLRKPAPGSSALP
ncbi:MAG: hypothetical protein Q8L95_02045 [Burkholderiales bacterium]|nr:hypothetical protein [Burkholderiales bacterium]